MSTRGAIGCAALSMLALLGGCSTIPQSSSPRVVPVSPAQQTQGSAEKPPTGLTGGHFIRKFFEASVNAANNHAAARKYLTDKAATVWNDHKSTTIVDNEPRIAPAQSGRKQPGTTVWNVSGQALGQLRGGSYEPQTGSFAFTVRLRRVGADGWRIENPPKGVWFTHDTFLSSYRDRPVYFLDPSTGRLVADRRWVARGSGLHESMQLIRYLLGGPSHALNGAVRSAIPSDTTLASRVTTTSGGGIEVNLSSLDSLSTARKKQLAAQVVGTLLPSAGPITVLTDGKPLVPGKAHWDRSDLSAVTGPAPGTAENSRALVAAEGKVTTLAGREVAVPSSSRPCDLRSASQSLDGAEFGLICRKGGRVRLRVGAMGGSAVPVGGPARSLSEPTWQVAGSGGEAGYALWTVAGGKSLRRVTGNGRHWTTGSVGVSRLRDSGQRIQAFQLSRDGVRFAAVVDGTLKIGSLHHKSQGGPSLVDVYSVRAPKLTHLVDLAWADSTHVVVAGDNPASGRPPVVAKVAVDGSTTHRYKTKNLTNGVASIAATSNKSVLVADSSTVWRSSGSKSPFRSVGRYYRKPVPFYPG
jgi:hypothetical protein